MKKKTLFGESEGRYFASFVRVFAICVADPGKHFSKTGKKFSAFLVLKVFCQFFHCFYPKALFFVFFSCIQLPLSNNKSIVQFHTYSTVNDLINAGGVY